MVAGSGRVRVPVNGSGEHGVLFAVMVEILLRAGGVAVQI